MRPPLFSAFLSSFPSPVKVKIDKILHHKGANKSNKKRKGKAYSCPICQPPQPDLKIEYGCAGDEKKGERSNREGTERDR